MKLVIFLDSQFVDKGEVELNYCGEAFKRDYLDKEKAILCFISKRSNGKQICAAFGVDEERSLFEENCFRNIADLNNRQDLPEKYRLTICENLSHSDKNYKGVTIKLIIAFCNLLARWNNKNPNNIVKELVFIGSDKVNAQFKKLFLEKLGEWKLMELGEINFRALPTNEFFDELEVAKTVEAKKEKDSTGEIISGLIASLQHTKEDPNSVLQQASKNGNETHSHVDVQEQQINGSVKTNAFPAWFNNLNIHTYNIIGDVVEQEEEEETEVNIGNNKKTSQEKCSVM